MLTSSQQPGVPTFVSKQRTQVCFCASDRSYVAFNVCTWSVTLWKIAPHEPPLPLGNYCLWSPPPPRNFQWSSVRGGGYGYFLEPHINQKYLLRRRERSVIKFIVYIDYNVCFQMHQKKAGTNIDLMEQFNIYEVSVRMLMFCWWE